MEESKFTILCNYETILFVTMIIEAKPKRPMINMMMENYLCWRQRTKEHEQIVKTGGNYTILKDKYGGY